MQSPDALCRVQLTLAHTKTAARMASRCHDSARKRKIPSEELVDVMAAKCWQISPISFETRLLCILKGGRGNLGCCKRLQSNPPLSRALTWRLTRRMELNGRPRGAAT
eukprot:1826252-Rhodomonas_salina.1